MLELTEKANQFISELKSSNNIPDNYKFRIKCEGAIGAPFKYNFGFDSSQKESDKIISVGSHQIIMDSESFYNVKGSQIDYSPSGQNSGLIFNNPNQTRSCGGNCKSHK